jgi:hypothetical protein
MAAQGKLAVLIDADNAQALVIQAARAGLSLAKQASAPS